MPAGKRSEPTVLVEMLVEAMDEIYQTLIEEWEAIPFMEERISSEEYRRRFRFMTPEQQRVEISRIGYEQVLRQLGMKEGAMP